MNDFLKRTILGALLGNFVFTMLIILNILMGNSMPDSFINNYIQFAFIFMFVGIGFGAPSIIYNDSTGMFPKEISYFRKIIFHMGFGFGFAYLGVFTMVQMSNRLSDPIGYLFSIVLMLAIGIFIWVMFYWNFKKESKKINKKLEYIQSTKNINSSSKKDSISKHGKPYMIARLICIIISCTIPLFYIIIENLGNLLFVSVTTIFLILLIIGLIVGFSDELKKKE
jgi:MFS family permease